MGRKRVLLSWSSGKDCAWALHALMRNEDFEVVGLLTTVNAAFDRVAMHGVRNELLTMQAEAVGLPLLSVPLPWPCSNEDYERLMEQALKEAGERFSMTHVAFGDLFLEDIRAYRVAKLAGTGLTPVFPLWDLPTRELAGQMISGGLRAYLTCIDPRKLPASFAGRAFDQSLIDDLPEGIDPCGENGEFHTFACAGPMFAHPIPVNTGEVVERDGFVYADLVPTQGKE